MGQGRTHPVNGALSAASEPPLSAEALLTLVGDSHWIAATRMGSDGISFAELQMYLRASLDRVGLQDARVEILDVDPEHPIPYWISDQDLLAAMTRASDDPTEDGLIIVRPGK